jgi:hypothetical protein
MMITYYNAILDIVYSTALLGTIEMRISSRVLKMFKLYSTLAAQVQEADIILPINILDKVSLFYCIEIIERNNTSKKCIHQFEQRPHRAAQVEVLVFETTGDRCFHRNIFFQNLPQSTSDESGRNDSIEKLQIHSTPITQRRYKIKHPSPL